MTLFDFSSSSKPVDSANALSASSEDGDPRSPKPISFDGLLTNRLLTSLPGEDFARLLPHLEAVFLPAGHDLYKSGETIDFVYFPETAVASHVYFFKDGGTTGAAIVGREGMLGLSSILNSGRSTYWTVVTLSGTALRASPDIIQDEFARGQAMHRLLLNYMHLRMAQISQKAVCNGKHKLEERLCTWLLMIHDRSDQRELSLTHEEVAYHLGVRRAGITSSFNALRATGVIDNRRGLIKILNRRKLEASACECYQALKALFQLEGAVLDLRSQI